MSNIFIYGEKEINYLKKVDPILGAVIDEIGLIERPVISDLFTALVHSIVGQQISSKAMNTVWKRFEEKFPDITPTALNNASADEIQQIGISMRKATYIKEAASKVHLGELKLDELYTLSEDEVIEKLTALHGIGVWTTEMMMIFCMQRPNIMSYGDFAIRKGLEILYRHEKLDKKLFDAYKRRYSPYASVASLYIWAVASGKYHPKTDENR